jgi:hypothetical protein
MKTTSCNGKKHYSFDDAPRCGAKTKRNNSNPCRSPAVRGKARCRIHGGSKGSGGQCGNKNALKHSYKTSEYRLFRKKIKKELKEAENFLDFFDN